MQIVQSEEHRLCEPVTASLGEKQLSGYPTRISQLVTNFSPRKIIAGFLLGPHLLKEDLQL